jgi:L-ribulose-5-phosphate 3-epimerase
LGFCREEASVHEERIGIMQGRLSPRPAGRLQAFPHASWQVEFGSARELGFDFLEWIYEAENAGDNPLETAAGRAQIRAVSSRRELPVGSVCADYFMLKKLAGVSASEQKQNVSRLAELVAWTRDIGASRILLPLLESSAVNTPELRSMVVDSLGQVTPVLDEHEIVLGLEMEIRGSEYAELIRALNHPRVKAYYDTGNSTAQGFDIALDVLPLIPMLEAVHIKDRVLRGGSTPLGQGSSNFAEFFRCLSRADFRGDFLLQHFFDADPRAAAAHSLGFVRRGLEAAREAA